MIPTLMRFGTRVAFTAFLAVSATCAHSADPAFLTGFRVGIVPTHGLRPSPDVNGFEDRSANVRVVISELPGGLHSSLANRFGPIGLQTLGMTVERHEAFNVSGGDGYLAKGHLAARGGVHMW